MQQPEQQQLLSTVIFCLSSLRRSRLQRCKANRRWTTIAEGWEGRQDEAVLVLVRVLVPPNALQPPIPGRSTAVYVLVAFVSVFPAADAAAEAAAPPPPPNVGSGQTSPAAAARPELKVSQCRLHIFKSAWRCQRSTPAISRLR